MIVLLWDVAGFAGTEKNERYGRNELEELNETGWDETCLHGTRYDMVFLSGAWLKFGRVAGNFTKNYKNRNKSIYSYKRSPG